MLDANGQFDGRATTLRPVHESATLARKSLDGTVAQNVARWGTEALNIDDCRVGERRLWPGNQLHFSKSRGAERPRVDGVTHPTVKPLDLMRFLVRLVTPPHGLVLDPFGGSGTSAEAALLEGRHAILIERDATYLPLIESRLRRGRGAA